MDLLGKASVKFFFLISTLLCIVPYHYKFKMKVMRVYAFMVLALYTILFLYTIEMRIIDRNRVRLRFIEAALELCLLMMRTALILLMIIPRIFTNPHRYYRVFEYLRYQSWIEDSSIRKQILFTQIVAFVTCIPQFIIHRYFFVNRDFSFMNYVGLYLNIIIVLNMYLVILGLHRRINEVNGKLQATLEYANEFRSIKDGRAFRFVRAAGNFQAILRQFTEFCDVIDLSNTLFGWKLLLLVCIISLSLIFNINNVYNYYEDKDKPIAYKWLYLSISLWNFCIYCLLGISLTYSCNRVYKAGHDVGKNCYKILLRSPGTSHVIGGGDNPDGELLLLIHLSTSRKPALYLAGTFLVDNSLLLRIFTSVIYYIIVILQFKDS
ncbi:PREDICTED: uncharacterized protein LOC108567638 [Nicrophorus vespilloides]|uniref:Gustatory receptor n=1 Tax=Nicrophorus vespilloides TaxID=110193 RepID=A0ABM1NA70_NICVS|nr:PREDICTED: uncharacterized protein LOC108567638 [Nicrophorus vespilloides]